MKTKGLNIIYLNSLPEAGATQKNIPSPTRRATLPAQKLKKCQNAC